MDWLFSNPLANLSGPAFLLAYAIATVAIVAVARLQISAADTSGNEPPPPVSVDRDPYEVAYLRGGPNELLRFTVFDLVRQGRLAVGESRKGKLASIVATGPSTGDESPLVRPVLNFYATAHTATELFASGVPAATMVYGKNTFEPVLLRDRLISSPAVRNEAARIRLYGAAALIGLAGYRFASAAYKGHNNVGFLIAEVLVALFILVRFTGAPRLSRRGRSYLTRLVTAVRPGSAAPLAAGAGLLPILVAATGIGALAGTPYAPFGTAFPRGAAPSGGGSYSNCSSACGSAGGSGGDGSSSSSCGSSGCGGGCGG